MITLNTSFTESNTNTAQKLSSGVNTTIELQNITVNTRQYPHTSQSKHTPPDAITAIIFLTSIIVLTPNNNFLVVPSLHSVSDLMYGGLCTIGSEYNKYNKKKINL